MGPRAGWVVCVLLSAGQRKLIIAYKLGATGRLPDTVGS
jgi:hypothetical protein